VIDVSDTGPGIDDQNISRIFEPFFTTKPVNEGTGMGLSMARGLIEQHDGTLTHHRTKGGGATFRITLPIEAVAPEENRDDTDDAQPIATAAARILIVDDEASIRMMLAECFGDVYDCVQCDSGVSALAAIEAEAFDLIFCDIRMPEMDGAALHRHLCAAHPEQAARMVFMTGDVLNRKGSLHAGIEGRPIIEKPFNPLDVRKLAARLVEDLGPIEWIQP
jgi:two-component system NtrC family sensor kinase